MKVCTDACLFGAWVTAYVIETKKDPSPILDIGTGTGLLSLMMAQKLTGTIDAVEIDAAAAAQAHDNISSSPWAKSIVVHNKSIQEFAALKKNELYPLIISNPPFFENDLTSPHSKKTLAKHEANLSMHELLLLSSKLLQTNGTIALLIPWNRLEKLISMANLLHLHPAVIVNIRQSVQHHYFRSIVLLEKSATALQTFDMAIKEMNGNYTNDFIDLLKDYYLYL